MNPSPSFSEVEMEEGLAGQPGPSSFSGKHPKVITLNNLSYNVIDNRKKDQKDEGATSKRKTILKDISFYVKPGMMVLVLGAPGGGRTSLFKVMANHTENGSKVEGNILFGGKHISPEVHHRQVAYITQQDNHLPSLSVRETLWFSGECSFGPSNVDEQNNRMEKLLRILGLKHVENTFVGNQFLRGISGGQKKRVTIGLDLLKGASVLLMDEPTTGLDSVTVVELMRCIQSLAHTTGISVVCALLQPPAEVLPLFDHLLLLNEGQVSYFGPMAEAHSYFKDMGFEAPPDTNEAEFFQEVVTTPSYFTKDGLLSPEQPQSPSEFALAFRSSPLFLSSILPTINELQVAHPHHSSQKKRNKKRVQTDYVNSFWRQTYLCLWRAWKVAMRDKMALISRFLTTFIMGFYFGVSFLFSGDSQLGAENRQNMLFISSMYTLFSTMITLEDLYNQRAVFNEQRDARKWYKTLPYFIAYSSTEVILGFLQCVLLCVEMYWLTGLGNGDGRFIYLLLNHYMLYLSNFAILFATSAITSSAFYPGVILPFLQMMFLVANGFVVPKHRIKGWWIWLYWTSPAMYSFEGMMINEFGGGVTLRCEDNELTPPTDIAIAEYQGSQICLITRGEQILRDKGYETDFSYRWVDLAILIGFTAAFLLFAFFSILLSHQTGTAGASGAVVVKKKKHKVKKNKPVEQKSTNHETGCALTFTNISYYVPVKGKKLKLLNEVYGYVEPGKLLALMGPSGAGKSTLLDVLAQRKRTGDVEGEILIAGRGIDDSFLRRTAYVMQTDILHASDTVREVVRFSASCRLPRHHSASYKVEFAEKVMRDMKLDKIGNEVVAGLSPEQRKRVSIAVELAANPQILFLDEPTSGLDSAGARNVMKCVHNFCRSNSSCSIICTIHQPSEEIFSLFDSLLLMATGGHTVYFGPLVNEDGLDRNVALLEHCKSVGYNMNPKANPADFILAFAAAKSSSQLDGEGRVDSVQGLNKKYEGSELAHSNHSNIKSIISSSLASPMPPAHPAATFITQTLECLYRSGRGFWRRRTELVYHIVRPLFLAIFLGTLFLRLDTDQLGATERVTVIFFSIAMGSLIGYTVIPTCASDRAVYYREKDSGTYSPLALCIAYIISGTILNGVVSFGYAFPAFWASGMDPHDRFTSFLFYMLTNFIGSSAFVTVGQLLSVALPSPGAAAVAFTMVEQLAILYGGFLIKREALVRGLSWLRHISFYKYSVESTAVQMLGGMEFYCKDSQFIMIPLPDGTTKEYCPYTTGDQILKLNGFEESWKWPDIGILIGEWFVLMVLFYLALKKIRYDS